MSIGDSKESKFQEFPARFFLRVFLDRIARETTIHQLMVTNLASLGE